VAGTTLRYYFRIDALSVIPDPQLKQTSAIPDVDFGIVRLCVAERISQCLARNAVNVVAEDWMKGPR
jgi:hypothetical protein